MFLSLNGHFIANNSYVDVDDIGEDDDALLCHTDKPDCCNPFLVYGIRAGEWYYPNGSRVGIQGGYQDEFYRNRRAQVVRLNRRQGTFTARGLFRCEVPDASGIIQTVFVNIGMYTVIQVI